MIRKTYITRMPDQAGAFLLAGGAKGKRMALPNAEIMMKRGMLWAAEGRQVVLDKGLTPDRFLNNAKMY